MSKALKVLALTLLACVCQTELAGLLRIAQVAPDFMSATLTALGGTLGTFGGFCAGSVMAMLYDASVGYVLAINLVGLTFIGYAAPLLLASAYKRLRRLRFGRALGTAAVCFLLTAIRETLNIGYLFLIGAEQSIITILRMLLCCAYSAALAALLEPLTRRLLTPKPKKRQADFEERAR